MFEMNKSTLISSDEFKIAFLNTNTACIYTGIIVESLQRMQEVGILSCLNVKMEKSEKSI